MRVTVIGAGGVGGYFGARLLEGGCDVNFVARGAHLDALRARGLRVESKLGNIEFHQVCASDDPAHFGPADLVLICVKLWDTESAARLVRTVMGPDTAVISLQNGVQKEEMLRRVLGDRAVLGGVCYISSKIISPGVISHTGTMQRLLFGELDGSGTARTEAFLAACRRGGIKAEVSNDIRRMIWEKFVFIVGVSAATTTMRQTIGPVCSNAQTRAFLRDVMREVVVVGRAHGVKLDEDFAEDRLAFCEGLPAEMTSSMHSDLNQGRPLEVAWLSGSVVELGRMMGIPTPLNRAVSDILALQAQGTQHEARQ
jgi:2-dehydropantoate 2-reductase